MAETAIKLTAELPPFNLRLNDDNNTATNTTTTIEDSKKDCCRCCELPVPQSNSVRLIPCGCILCKNCMIVKFLFKTRLEPDLKCCSCGQVVASHQAEQRSNNNPPAAASGLLDVNKPKPGPNVIPQEEREGNVSQDPSSDSVAKSVQDSNIKTKITNDREDGCTEDGSTEKDSKPAAKSPKESSSEDSKLAATSAQENSTEDSKPAAKSAQESSADDIRRVVRNFKKRKPGRPRKTVPKKRKPAQKRKATDGEADDGAPKEKKPKVRKRNIALDENGNPKYPKLLLPRPRKPFEEHLADLKEFRKKFGHSRVPVRYPENPGLGKWVRNVRGGIKKITRQERLQLNEAGFIWETRSNQFRRAWKEQFERLKLFKRRFGDCYVPWNWSEDKVLSEWVHTQRKLYSKGQLKDDRKKELESIGFAWRGQGSTSAAKLRAMKIENGGVEKQWFEGVKDVKDYYADGSEFYINSIS